MASEKPSPWAVDIARKLTPVQCGFKGGSDLGWHGTMEAIATALDAARNEGRREREGEIVKFLRGEAASALNILDVADDIERGAGRKGNDRG